ncbi:exonuclease domain-containing protein [Sphingobacterium sp. UT-1RO-CII-1]|uniref:exonuclease domain-containing protein n=1 Tax=Sphingobacterium sp. UT-1RO-CII-1 TaxID=2995225 RepID=UPI00227C17B5|nr:exonuclease domain-containing protein [Sphingobacterium sp. UT-1RO-CII-1]MCY4779197.1 exonuclease domain-containing protein [Sphingobacterium sp. UT-1RO-CII-1]
MNKQKDFAIVDIETTGSHASGSRITEIAIVIHNGKKIIDRYETLINPDCPIPYNIQVLTGISPEMVESAPRFEDIAEDIFHLLQGKIFVAHNVNFDFSFIVKELKQAGYEWQAPKLCTVRLARKIIPGYKSYSLGKLCAQLDISIQNRHRAMGDTEATVKLFEILLKKDTDNYILQSIRKNTEHRLPPQVSGEDFAKIPETTGIYLFRNKKGKIIYVGKALNIKKRILSHFTGSNTSLQRQEFIRNISSIDFQESGTELMALLMECQLIKKHWPVYNKALKKYEPKFVLVHYQDIRGYDRLAISKAMPNLLGLQYFETANQANLYLSNLIRDFNLSPAFCTFFSPGNETKTIKSETKESPQDIISSNQLMSSAIDHLSNFNRSFILIDKGRRYEEQSYIYYKENKLFALGFIDSTLQWHAAEDIVSYQDKCISNYYMQQLVLDYAIKNPDKVYNLPRP